jgi:hypothetical protein
MKMLKRITDLKTLSAICISTLFLILFTVSCTKTVGLEPKAAVVTQCDTISYAQDIAPIISNNCSTSGCHVPPNPTGPGVLLNTYELLKAKGEAGRIKARVIDETPTRMPPAGITPNEKKLIECWLNNGYKP